MKLKNRKSGFTLLEIIIVIIIVGVLASLALPRFFSTIEFSRSTEALNVIGSLKRAADRCALAIEAIGGLANDFANCVTYDEMGIEDPELAPGNSFTYGVSFAGGTWTTVATRNAGSALGDTITFDYVVATGVITRTGSAGGAYAGLK